MNKEKYKKMYVLSPKYYEKLQKQKVEVISDHPLDEMLLKILQSKEPNNYKKWLMYKNALIKFRESKDKNTLKTPANKNQENEKDITFSTPYFKKVLKENPNSYFWDSKIYNTETPVTTKPRKSVTFRRSSKDSDLFSKYRRSYNEQVNSSLDNSSSSNNSNVFDHSNTKPYFDSTRNQDKDDIFEHDPANDVNESMSEEVEKELFSLAQSTLGEKNEQNIIRLEDTLGKDFRAFENHKTRDIVAVQVEPVKNYVENDVPMSLTREEEERRDVSPVVHDINEYVSEQHTPRFIRLAESSISQSQNDFSNARSFHLRSRKIKARKLDKRGKMVKNRINQPQQGSGIEFIWKTFNQKRYK